MIPDACPTNPARAEERLVRTRRREDLACVCW